MLDQMEIEVQAKYRLTLTCGSLRVVTSASCSVPWCTLLVITPEGPPFYAATKMGRLGHGNKRAVIGHFQKARLAGKLKHGCLVCCQTQDNLIRDLIS